MTWLGSALHSLRFGQIFFGCLSALSLAAACSSGSSSNPSTGGKGGTANSGGTAATNTGGVAALAAASGTYNGGSGGSGAEFVDAGPCFNGVQDGTETDLDCGGWCGPCALGRKCLSSSDCAGTDCVEGVCCGPAALGVTGCPGTCLTCLGGEVGACHPAGDGQCAGKDTCDGVVDFPPGPHCRCFDGAQDYGETGVDCGGNCAPCGGACGDGQQNNGETDIDCGGAKCATKCGVGKWCSEDSDCDSTVCFRGKCCAPDSDSVTCAGKDCAHVSNNCGQIVACGPDTCPTPYGRCISGKCQSM